MAKVKRIRTVKPDPITQQVNPVREQMAKREHRIGDTINPWEHNEPGEPAKHKAFFFTPSWQTIASRGCYSADTTAALSWYAERLATSRLGAVKSCLDTSGCGNGNYTRSEAVGRAVDDVADAFGLIMSKAGEVAADTFNAVMHYDKTLSEISGGNTKRAEHASKMFYLAASWLMLGFGHRVMT